MPNVTNYVTSNRFYIEMESNITASFSECAGLEAKIKTEKIPVGGVNDQQRVLLGHTEYSDVILKRGVTDDLVFWDWVTQVWVPGRSKRRNINVLVFNQAGETMQCWTLLAAVPVGWKSPALKADSNTVAIEELTLAYEGLKIARTGGGGASELSPSRLASGYFPGT
jgi:phage tail-like protein